MSIPTHVAIISVSPAGIREAVHEGRTLTPSL